jgi:hypothetical protein
MRLIKAVLPLIAVLLMAWPANSQETTFKNPIEVKLRVNRSDYNRNSIGGNFEVENFYPVGWSKDGKFAYYVEPVDEACGCYFGKLVIVDLKNDMTVWQFDYTSEDDAENSKKPKTLAALWAANRKLFSAKLNENKIEPQRIARTLPFPIIHKTDRVTANLSVERKPVSKEDRIYGDVARARVELTSRHNGKKTVLDEKYPEAMPLHVGMLGYLKSPLEPRVAIILVEIYRGYEGPPHVGNLKIVGAALDKNFR